MKRIRWAGPHPVMSSIPYASVWEETDDDGSIWFVALGSDGREVERALLEAKGKRKAENEAIAGKMKAHNDAVISRRIRLQELRKKKESGKLTAADKEEILMLLADSVNITMVI